jgi:hypothetical protein
VVSWLTFGGWRTRTLLALPVLEHLHGHEGSTASDDLVAELGFVVILLVGLVVVVLGVAWKVLDAGRLVGSCLSYRIRTCWLI